MRLNVILFASVLACLGLSNSAHAEPTGVATTLIDLRPYVGGNQVFVYPADPSPCNTMIYTIDLSSAAGKAAYAAALAAVVSGKRVQLEAVAPCTGQYSALQSIHILPN